MNAMKKMIAVAAVAVAGFAAFAAGEGAAPTSSDTYSFTYQACLRDEHGNVITKDGAVQRNQVVILRLWPTAAEGGTPLWARKFAVFTDETGLFNLEVSDSVGSQEPAQTNSLAGALSSAKPGQLYIGLEVENSAGEIVPRQRLFAVPFAAVANDVRAITQDIPVSGTLTFAKGSEKVVVSADGISQKGAKSSSFHAVEADKVVAPTVNVGTIGSNSKSGKPIVTVDANIDVGYDATVKGGATVTGDATVSGNATVTGSLTVGGTQVISVPVGGIIMWTKPQLPDNEHWAICDGDTHNGVPTPDLRGRFIVGASPDGKPGEGADRVYSVGNNGGESFHKLSADELPKHNHTTASPWKHLYRAYNYREAGDDPRYIPFCSMPDNGSYNVGGGDSVTWGDFATKELPHENRPPYYALYYIMRIK